MAEKAIGIKEIISDLIKRSTFFVSEMDFQFALGNKLKENFPHHKIYMGYRAQGDFYNEAMHIDIVLMNKDDFIPIELKYKTKRIEVELSSEKYIFKCHGAYPDNCLRYINDIKRVERLKEHKKFKIGYAVFLTNDEKYQKLFQQDYVGKNKIPLHDISNRTFEHFENGYFCLINTIQKKRSIV